MATLNRNNLTFKIAVFALSIIVADQLIGQALRRSYFSMKAGENYRTTYTIDSTRAEIIIFGSSRANHHYVPDIFEKNLKMSCYNAGRDGNYLIYNFATFKAVTHRYKPRTIIFDINLQEIIKNKSEYEKLSNLLPYYKDHPELRSIIDLKSTWEKYKLISEIYPFNSQILRILFRNVIQLKSSENESKVYLPLFNKLKTNIVTYPADESIGVIDSFKIKSIKEIAKICKGYHMNLMFLSSPIFSGSIDSTSAKILKELAKNENFTYIDFSNDNRFCHQNELFQDNVHLNDCGAQKYSSIICDKLISIK